MKHILRTTGTGALITAGIFVADQAYRWLSGQAVTSSEHAFESYLYYALYGIPLTLVNFFWINHIRRYYRGKRKGYHLLGGIAGSILVILPVVIVLRWVHKGYMEDSAGYDPWALQQLRFYTAIVIISLLISLLFHLFYFYRNFQENRVKEQKIIAGTASARFDALKNQLDPHFLFNSLNVLTSLIDEKPEAAQKFTTSLSKIYRYVLEQKNKELVTVNEELGFARTYAALLKMRFENSISFDMPEYAVDPEAKVVPLSLQLLLENAVKHNRVSEKHPLKIAIYEEGGCLVTRNNKQPKQTLKKGSGVGLVNISQRYKLLTRRKVSVEEDDTCFRVSIPILTKQITIVETPDQNMNQKYLEAKRHVEALKEFYWNLASYCIIIPFLVFINYRTSWEYQWFWFPAVGWGVGLTFHAISVFMDKGFLGRRWEERKIREYMEEEKRRSQWE